MPYFCHTHGLSVDDADDICPQCERLKPLEMTVRHAYGEEPRLEASCCCGWTGLVDLPKEASSQSYVAWAWYKLGAHTAEKHREEITLGRKVKITGVGVDG